MMGNGGDKWDPVVIGRRKIDNWMMGAIEVMGGVLVDTTDVSG